MTIKKLVQAGAVAVLFAAGSVAAQTASGVNVTTSPNAGTVSPGAAVNLGTITFSAVQNGGSVASVPITITGGGGGVGGNLSNCQIYNSAGGSLTGNSVVHSVGSGASTFTFNQPFTVNPTTGNQTLTVRCDVASNTVSGSYFTINAGNPTLATSTGTGSTSTPSLALRINLDTAPSVPAGSQDVTLANISFGALGAGYTVTSVPLTITASSNGSTANFTGCVIRDTTDLNVARSNAHTIVSGSATTFVLTAPISVPMSGQQMLALTCDVSSAAAVGTSYSISVNPAMVAATNSATGATVTATGFPSGSFGPNGLPAATSGTVIVSAAGSQPTPPGGGTGSGTGTPGVPNTGLGTQLAMLLTIALAGLIALGGSMYLGRKRV